MRTQEYVLEKIKDSGLEISNLRSAKKEIAILPEILGDSEELLYVAIGAIQNVTGIIACTDERVILLDKGFIFRHRQKDIPLSKINSVTFEKGILFSKVTILDASSSIFVEVVNDTVERLVGTIKNAISNINTDAMNKIDDKEDIVAQLNKLNELKTQGILTDEEFVKAKAKVLS